MLSSAYEWEDAVSRWEKVVILHGLLEQSRCCVPLKTILNKLECSESTFFRVMDLMKFKLGAPIEFDKVHDGYFYDLKDGGIFQLPGLWFTTKEVEALLCLDSTIRNLGENLFAEIFTPLRIRLDHLLSEQSGEMDKIRDLIKIIPISMRRCDEKVFNAIARAVFDQTRITIHHHKIDNPAGTDRDISPQCLVRYRDNWYVDAFCHECNELRTFALNRIESVTPLRRKFHHVDKETRDEFFSSAYGIFTGKADKTAVIHFSGIAAREVSSEQWHPEQKGEWISETTFRLSIPYNNPHELIMDILKWGELAEVIAPDELRKSIVTIIEGMGQVYLKSISTQ